MEKKIIELQNGILIEVNSNFEPSEIIEEEENDDLIEVNRLDRNAANSRAKYGYPKVDVDFKTIIKEKVLQITENFGETWIEMNKTAKASSASVELGFDFEAKGNIFLAETSAKASIKVTINWDFDKL